MPKKCFVPKCNSGYKTCKDKVSLFRVPNNEALLQQWQNAIAREDRVISRKDHVCEKHFQENDIIRYWIYKDIKDKLKIPRLKKTAVPSIFPEKCPSSTSDSTETLKPTKTRKKKKPVDEPDNEPDTTYILYESTETSETLKFEKTSDLFNKLWYSEVVVTVPSPSWAIHKVENCTSKAIIISDVVITDNIPCYQKQIIMNDDDTISIIIGTNIITQEEQTKYFGSPVGLHSLEDLNILISSLHLLNFTLSDVTFESESCDLLNN